MRIVLVNMPWASVDVPSLALGILTSVAGSRFPADEVEVEVEVLHANVDFCEWVSEQRSFTFDDYGYYSIGSYFDGCGDWVFSSALHGVPSWRADEFDASMKGKWTPHQRDLSHTLHALAPEFIDRLAHRIVATSPDLVGFTSTFQQNTASLATAQRVKELNPAIRTVLGGANCDGVQGAAMHRNFPAVDYVVRGEGEAVFADLLTALADDGDLAPIPGLCWRDQDGTAHVNPTLLTALSPSAIARPVFDDYFERVEGSIVESWASPKLVVEGARGCWWGEKHHCTFCGLNGSSMTFRSKSPESFFEELVDLAIRHQVLDFLVTDNIMDMGYFTSLLPALAESGYDFRFHYEIKSNVRRHQLANLARAGVVQVQPGIESLNKRVLNLMDKGVTGCMNVRMLRDAQSVGVWPTWNYLYGFPGERDGDYLPVMDQFPALHHLTPPASASRIVVERFSPYFDRPELGFAELRPAGHYRIIYDLPDRELLDMAYLFSAPERGIGQETADRLESAVDTWRSSHSDCRLVHWEMDDAVLFSNSRPHYAWSEFTIADPVSLALFRLLDGPRGLLSLVKRLTAELGVNVTHDDLQRILDRWTSLGLVFHDGGQYIHLATRATNQELARFAGS
ncbi:RiPP maturation radical SAM C-methyltransferase [Spirillospora sp. NPDC052269]